MPSQIRIGPSRRAKSAGRWRDTWKAGVGRIEAIPRRTRLLSSSLFFVFCLGGLFWADHLEAKYPPTEKDKQQLENMKKFRLPTRGDFSEAKEQAMRAQAAAAEPKQK